MRSQRISKTRGGLSVAKRQAMYKDSDEFRAKDFWRKENLRYSQVHFRLEKCARIVNKLADGRECDLLDIGCGPATLAKLLEENIHYYGMDIAIQDPAPNLVEMDLAQNEIRFGTRTFDIAVVGGVFEYLGSLQRRKLAEIHVILNPNGKFVVTFLNFNHINDKRYDDSVYNNIQSIQEFKRDLEDFFHVDSWFTCSLNWHRSQPSREFLRKIEMPLAFNIPILSHLLAVDYLFICSQK